MNRKHLFISGLFFIFINPAFSQNMVIKAGRLIDVEKGTALNGQEILVEGHTIARVGSHLDVPSGTEVIDLSEYTVLSGLIDAHTHLCTDVSLDSSWRGNVTERFTSYTLQTSTGYRAITGVQKARSVLLSGFTTVRDLGNAGNYADTDLRKAIEDGLVPGPTVINSGRIISPFGGQFQLYAERPELGIPEYVHADTRDELKKAIREAVHFGAKVIKLVVDAQPYIYSIDDLKYIVKEAENAGVKVAAHCHSLEAAFNSATAGVASIEHGTHMTDEVLLLAKENGVVLVGTEMPKWVLEQLGMEKNYPIIVDRLKRAYKIGITMAYGSDTLYEIGDRTRGEMALTGLECWIDAGIPNEAILRTMTINSAKLLGVENERGTIKPGLAADIIAVQGDPLADILALNNVVFVMKDGTIIKSP